MREDCEPGQKYNDGCGPSQPHRHIHAIGAMHSLNRAMEEMCQCAHTPECCCGAGEHSCICCVKEKIADAQRCILDYLTGCCEMKYAKK